MPAVRFAIRSVVSFTCTLIAVAALLPACFGQTVTTGEVTGTALDATNAVVSNAPVILKNVNTGEARVAITNGAGVFRFTFVRPGAYEVSAKSAGLRSDVVRVTAGLGQVQTVNLVMKIEEPKQTVDVSDAAPLLDTENAQSIYTLTERQIEELPLPGGDLVGVAYTAPGAVIANRYGTNGNFVLQGIGGVSNLYTVNGADDMNPYWNLNNYGATGLMLGANEIQETSVIQNAYEGQYGRNAGAQVNFVSKSGTNGYHGNLVYNYNGSVLDANDGFNNSAGIKRPREVSNQYAASFGGRIIRDKLFFFVDTEGLRYVQAGSTAVLAAPSKALEQYTLKTIQPSQAGLYQKAFALWDAAPGRSQAAAVTTGAGSFQDSSGRLGCGGLAGTPNGTGGTFGVDVSCADAYSSPVRALTTEWLASARLDYNLSARQHMFLRFKTDHGVRPGSISPISSVFNTTSSQPDYEVQLNHTFNVTSRLTNNFTGAFSYYSYEQTFANFAEAVNAFPFRFNLQDGGTNRGTVVSMGAAANSPNGQRAGNGQLVDDVSYTVGNHSLTAGVNYRLSREADLQFAAFDKITRFNFASLGDFARGAIDPNSGSTYLQTFPTTPVLHIGMYSVGFYLQDQWSATSHLKLTGTLRFDRHGNPDCFDRCFARLASPFAEVQKGVSIPYNQSIQTGLRHPFYSVDPIMFQPRFSAAYSPQWAKGTVIRGGVGLFSDMYPAVFASALAGNAPEIFTAFIQTGSVNTGGAGSAPQIAATSAAAFRNGFASGATLTQLQKAVAPSSFGAPRFFSVPSALHTPMSAQWSLEVQHQLGQKNVASVRYAGNHGYNQFVQNFWANAAVNANNYPNGFGGLPMATPDPRFASVTQLTNAGFSNYNGMVASLRRAFGSSLQGEISYTWSHALDVLSNGGILNFAYDSYLGQMDPLSPSRLNYSSADYDTRHNMTLDFVWHVPMKSHNRLLKTAFGGWLVSDKTNWYTGTPFTVFNNRLAGRAATNLAGYAVLAAVTDPNIRRNCGHESILVPCFTASQFASLTTQTGFGNTPRNSFRGPGFLNIDTSLSKQFAIGERTRFTLGATAYNLFNHPDLSDPNGNVANPGLGLITFSGTAPSSPYGWFGGPPGRAVVVTGKLAF